MYATGLVKTILENKPAKGARVTLLSLNGGIMEETYTDLHGKFKIEGLKFLEGMKFTVQAKSNLPGVKLKVFMDNIMPEAGSPGRKTPEISNSQQSTITGSSIINEKFLKDNKKGVKVAGSKQRIVFTEQIGLEIDQSKVDRSIYLNNPELCPNLAI
ncbi:MAG: hypothetical protein EOO85_14855, partial [Pedobacter sp.]